MRFRTVIIALSLLLFLSFLAAPVSAQPVFPHAFYGDVTIGGQPAPVGTVVSAKVNGVEGGYVTTWEGGEYGWGRPGLPGEEYQGNLLVQGEHVSGGDTIEFYINNFKAYQTATFHSGELTELDLTVAYAPPITAFYGNVTIGDQPAPVGTVVSAKVNGVEGGNVTAWEVGAYGWGREEYQGNLLVQGGHISSGDTIAFYVDGVKADQIAEFQSGGLTKLDLTAPAAIPTPSLTPTATPTVTPTPTPTPTATLPPVDGGGLSGGAVAGIAVGALIAGALIAWLILRRRGEGD